ncbi:C6 zinc finger domain protein [Colletotrichum truncatum]|uniref:C6 zinc finger domain protein n=1 Tax=Colletotrichum truncatum TaxID=5467 RepID=A0ACC3YLL0_COLTU|nr:C6 zinc finger domain protein [Colletotrichum truncatum]KAF6780985.1 C6 zinc finger domain protein [Colletotrichum truncatum]
MTSVSRRLALATTAAPPPQPSHGGNGRRQCWECQRRRVVCDAARPVCGKCKATGVVCPGYEDKKPLTWLTPGKVKTRTWKRKKPSDKDASPKSSSSEDGSDTTKSSSNVSTQLVHIFPGVELRSETCDFVEATMYWNDQVYPSFLANQLTSSPWVIPVTYIHLMPRATQHALVSMAIDHRMLRIGRRKNDPFIVEVQSRFHQHRCAAIQALNEDVNNDRIRGADSTFGSVMVFMFADLMGSATTANWRHHLNGLAGLMAMRGGFEVMFRTTPYLHPLLLFPKIVEVMANTTSPAHDQVGPTTSYKNIDMISELFQLGYYPLLPCPVELFADIIRINRLRFLIATNSWSEDLGSVQSAAENLVESIIEFSPEIWVESKTDSKEMFLLMGRVYQSATALYAISSLQCLGALPLSAGWKAVRTIHYGRLFALLDQAANEPMVKHCVAWPLIVAGFEAASGSAAGRAFVVKQCITSSKDLGAYLPLAAVRVLETFWASGKRTWDECFDTPHALVA